MLNLEKKFNICYNQITTSGLKKRKSSLDLRYFFALKEGLL